MHNAVLLFKNEKFFYGKSLGKLGITTGEICFTTGITGYQHTITDPSFAGQIITFTFPHIGNVGINDKDYERDKIFAKGIILREEITRNPSHPSSYLNIDEWLKKNNIVGICGIDTRALTKHLRDCGSIEGVIYSSKNKIDTEEVKKHLNSCKSMKGQELTGYTAGIAIKNDNTKNQINKKKVIIIDFGMKTGIINNINDMNIIIIPGKDNFAERVISNKPDGIILSNGPGDPEATAKYTTEEIKKLLELNLPIFGICLGHQLLAISLGCKTKKMKNGHRGSNHPVYNLSTKKVEISSQNHGFTVDEKKLPDNIEITHKSLFDGDIEGIKVKNKPIFSVQYHPEAHPGPNDSRYLFQEFTNYLH
ncbi:MAG: glutamine-hydrolyzing carbamoyl-phosphate synthase small subunit [Rickettsiaceae bacterium H1]|nr:glutamine-hydrolyzing carbamoyl-phosphate synthase small subunit [Rickettsiaceae bacterium H1]